jgi:serine/threonine protein kinase
MVNTRHFKTERQILANLEHPNIASLLDGGTTEDGYPYLVMEYVQGVSIDSYCQSKQLNIKEKLELFIKVCSAVDYAHQNHIVHRDLKPANILITEKGNPKLLDFGIAKLLLPETPSINKPKTLLEFPLMTPEYASPEQLMGDTITITTDVYALGVILYELLTGQRPYKLPNNNIINIGQTICNKKILPPSECNPELRYQLQGDLDNITLFALKKQPEFRYQTIHNLVNDLKLHLAGKPVKAGDNSYNYRFKKFVNRNKIGVGLSSLVVLVLMAGIIISSWQWQIAQDEQKRANKHYKEVRGLANTMVFDVSDSIAKLPGSTKLRKSLLNKGTVQLDRLAQQHLSDKKLQNETAKAYSKLAMIEGGPIRENIGHTLNAQENLIKSLAIWETLTANEPVNLQVIINLAQGYKQLSGLFAAQGKYKQALNNSELCIATLEQRLAKKQGREIINLVGCYLLTAHWLTTLGEYSLARKNLFTAFKSIEDLNNLGLFPFKLRRLKARFHEELAEVEAKTGDINSAVENERKRLSIVQKSPGNQRKADQLAYAYQGLAARLARTENLEKALQAYHQSLTIWSKRVGYYPEDVRPRQGMAGIYAELSKLHLLLANQINEKKSRKHKKIACDFYQRSQQLLDKLPEPEMGFGIRYSWLLSPLEVLRSLAIQC